MPFPIEIYKRLRGYPEPAFPIIIDPMENWVIRSVIGDQAVKLLIDEKVEVRRLNKERYCSQYALGEYDPDSQTPPLITMSVMCYKSSMVVVGFDCPLDVEMLPAWYQGFVYLLRENGPDIIESTNIYQVLGYIPPKT